MMAETSSEAQQHATAMETSLPAEPHATETQAKKDTVTGPSQDEVSDPVSSHGNTQEAVLSISRMLEENATKFREEEKGIEFLSRLEPIFNPIRQPPNLVLPREQGSSIVHWKPDERTLARWKACRTEQPTPAGQIWWMVDTLGCKTFGLGIGHVRPRYMQIEEAVMLIECLLQGAVIGDDGLDDLSRFEDHTALVFYSSYTRPSGSMAPTSLCLTCRTQAMQVGGRCLPQIEILHLQYHLAYLRFVPEFWWGRDLESLSEDRPGLILERHAAKIRRLSHARTSGFTSAMRISKENSSYELSEERFEECRLSMSLHLYGKGGEFRLLVVGDVGAQVNLEPSMPFEERHASSSLRLDPNSLGHLAGLTHFLVNLVHLVDTWHKGWKDTLKRIDDIVGFEMDHTFDDRQLESHIFDTSDSMDLSKQYFTTLQLLRIARQRIDNTISAWKQLRELPASNRDRLHKSTLADGRVLSTLDKFVLSEGYETGGYERIFDEWEEQRNRVTQLFETRAKQLTERIDQKTKEVESLRDGLFNATSLREAMKGMALNRAIYLFTAVTIIFTPLSFLTALWALPILNTTPQGDSIRPSSNAFLATFIIIPALTYIICGYYAWYLTSTKTWKTCAKFIRVLLRNAYFIWDVCAKYACYPFSKSTRKDCADYVERRPGDVPAWALKAIKWLARTGRDSPDGGTA